MSRLLSVQSGGIVEPKALGGIRTVYRIRTFDDRVVLDSRATFPGREFVSRSVFDPRGMRLREHMASTILPNAQRRAHVRVVDRNAFVAHKLDGHGWTEVLRLPVGPRLIPFVAYCYAEVAFLMRFLDWKTEKQQVFPMLHANCGSDFGFQDFYYVFQVVDASLPISRVRCANVFRGGYGTQLERYDMWVSRSDLNLVGSENVLRGLHFEKDPEPFRFWHPPKVSPLRIQRASGKGRIAAEVGGPYPLRLCASGGSSRPTVWLFDLLRLNYLRGLGTPYVRQNIARELEARGVSCLTFDGLLTNSEVGPTKLPEQPSGLTLDRLRLAVQKLWSELSLRVRSNLTVLVIEENCFSAPVLFAELDPRPSLIFIDPSWGTPEEWASSLGRPEIKDQGRPMLDLLPGGSVEESTKAYGRPILAIGPTAPPLTLRHCVEHILFSRDAWLDPEPHPSFDSRFWFLPQKVHREAIVQAARWVKNR